MRKLIPVVFVLALIALVFTLESRRQETAKQLERMTVRLEQLQGNSDQSKEAAKRVIESVRKHMDLSLDVEPTVATIVNVDELRSRNSFYWKAENGDHLIVTTDRAILYDPDKDIIIDVIPVQLQQTNSAEQEPKEKASTSSRKG